MNGSKILLISASTLSACLVVGIDIFDNKDTLSTQVVIAPFLLVPMIVSISQSPCLILSSTISGLCDIDTLSLMPPLYLQPYLARL